MEKFLVCRVDALRPNGHMRTSEYFPMVVEFDRTDRGAGADYSEEIVRKALDSINKGYVGMYEYIVVPLRYAVVVGFKPRQQYEVHIEHFS